MDSPGAPAVHLLRCNPYGHSTGAGGDRGPKHLMGGLYGPQYEGGMKWQCQSAADGWYVMTCRCGHKGQRMPLCGPHVLEIGRRQSSVCPPCAMPPRARELHEAIGRARSAIVSAHMMGWSTAEAVSRHEALAVEMTELYHRGIIHRCPLILSEVS